MSRKHVLVRLEWLAVVGVVLAAGAIAQAEDRVLRRGRRGGGGG